MQTSRVNRKHNGPPRCRGSDDNKHTLPKDPIPPISRDEAAENAGAVVLAGALGP